MHTDANTTDATLLAAWTEDGDNEALAALVHRYAPLVHSVCCRQCRSHADAEDAFQVTFMLLARSAPSIRSAPSLPGWLHSTAYRVAARSRQRPLPQGTTADVSEPIADEPDPLEAIARRHDLCVLDEELNQLAEPLRAAMILHYLHGLRLRDVAQRMGTSLGAIRGRLQRGRNELRQRMILRGVSLGTATIALATARGSTAEAQQWAARCADTLATYPELVSPHPMDAGSLASTTSVSSSRAVMKYTLAACVVAIPVVTLTIPWTAVPTVSAQNPRGSTIVVDAAADGESPQASTVRLAAAPPSALPSPAAGSAAIQAGDPSSGGQAGVPAGGAGGWGMGGLGMGGMGMGMGGMGMGGVAGGFPVAAQPQPEPAAQPSAYEQRLQSMLGAPSSLPEGEVTLDQLLEQVRETTGAPVIYQPGLAAREISGGTVLQVRTGQMPLGPSLNEALRPLNLRAIVADDAIVVTADATALARQGIGTSRYVNVDDDAVKAVEALLEQTATEELNQMPLKDALTLLLDGRGITYRFDMPALEDIGLTTDAPVSARLEDVPVETALKLILKPLDMTWMPEDSVVIITTQESARDFGNLYRRTYWLDATGLTATTAKELIEGSVDPEEWESMGGPSTIVPLSPRGQGRHTLVISAPYGLHREIEKLLQTLRDGLVDPEGGYASPDPTVGAPGGGFGMGGFGGGGMF